MTLRFLSGALLLGALLPAGSARAQVEDALREAERALTEGDFIAADHRLDDAAAGAMDHAALLRWLELRALVAYSGERLGALEEALSGLASVLVPGDPAPSLLPPPVRTRLDELRALDVRVEVAGVTTALVEEGGRRVGVVAEARRDPGSLVRSLRVVASVDGGADVDGEGEVIVRVPGDVGRDVVVRYRIEAVGPGGAIVATLGSEREPREEVIEGVPPDPTGLIAGLTTAGIVLVLGGIAVAVVGVQTDGFRFDGRTTVVGPALAPVLRF